MNMWNKFLLLVANVLVAQVALAQYDLYVYVNFPGTLEETVQQISDSARFSTTSMKVMGPLNGKDMMFIRDMCGINDLSVPSSGKLRILDISETNIIGDEDVYMSMMGKDMISYDDHFGGGFLYNCSGLEELFLPQSIISIDTLALAGCSNLKHLEIPPTVQSIGYGAFVDCSSITTLTLPNSVTVLEEGAFQRMTSLEELTLGDNLVGLDNSALMGDINLKTLNLGNSFKDFSPLLFYNTPSLSDINVGSGNPNYCSIEGVMFNNNADTLVAFPASSSFEEYSVPEGVSCIAPWAFCNASLLKSVFMPASLETIDSLAFFDCHALENVQLNEGLRTIAFGAFGGLSCLQDLSVPSSVSKIEGGAFLLNTALARLHVDAANLYYSVGENGWLYDIEKKNLYYVPSTTQEGNIPETVNSVGDYAFAGVSQLPHVVLGDNVTSIGDGAFAYSNSISQIMLGKNISEIGERVVDGCDNLHAVYCFMPSLDDDKINELAFFDESGAVAEQCTLYVLPGSLFYYTRKKGFSIDGLSFFAEVKEMVNADGIREIDRLQNAKEVRLYDVAGRKVESKRRGVNITIGEKGRALKLIVK